MSEYNDWYILDAPKKLSEIYGQDLIVKALKENFKNRNFPKAVFFQGIFGSGKTILAKILARALACRTPLEDGSGCLTCPSCLSVDKENWNRDIIYINAAIASAGDVRETVEKNLVTPAIRDASKIFLVDEVQGLSKEGLEAFLIATQSPLKNTFFIFTAMEKLQGTKANALQSRCKVWKMKVPLPSEIYMYLGKYAQNKGLTKNTDIPITFWKDGLKLLAENSKQSYRLGLQLLQQCYDASIFDINEIKTFFDFNAEEDAAKFLIELSNGKITDNARNVMIGDEYQEKFNLLLDMLGNAKIYSIFGKIYDNEEEKWKEQIPIQISKGKFFDILCDAFEKLSFQTYMKKGDFKIIISKVIESIKRNTVSSSLEQGGGCVTPTEQKVVGRRSVG
jgi:DNA polymerase III gamma/tau subunit